MRTEAERLLSIGWRDPRLPVDSHRLVRVVAQHRGGYEIHDGSAQVPAQPDARFLKNDLDPSERPMVGDFVRTAGESSPVIMEVLPRRSVLARIAAGGHNRRQLIASNVDSVFVLTGLDGDFSPSRIERYLSLIETSGARPVVLLGKADKRGDSQHLVEELRARLPDEVPLHAIDARDASSVAVLDPYLTPGDTAVVVGSSGAGKSTLTNTLVSREQMLTGGVRESDSRGRHTTTHRALLQLPGGACLIDTPGMRELKLSDDEQLALFSDIEERVGACKYSDCSHDREPGCAIQAALGAGELSATRWQSYVTLLRERSEKAEATAARARREAGRRPKARRGTSRTTRGDE